MNKLFLIVLICFACLLALPAAADTRQELEAARAEAVRARAFIRGAETQLTKTIAKIDAAIASLEAEPVDPPVIEPPVVDPPGPPASGAGFTALVKSADTRVIYVSSSLGSDSNDGRSESKPVKTLKHGASLVRLGSPDWLLLKAGDVWDGQNLEGVNMGGAGVDKPMVLGTYGEGPRPLIIPPHGTDGIKVLNNHIKGLVIQGLHIYPATRDPGSPRYVNRDPSSAGIEIRLQGSEGQYIQGLVIEDCKISHFDDNIKVVDDWARQQGIGVPGRMQVTIRRNIIRYASCTDSHSIGIYIEGSRDSIIEQNLLDHNGWAQTDGNSQRNKRSHNIYAQQFNGPLIVRHNIIARGAAHGLQLRAGGDIENNLFVRNAMAFYTSVNDSKANYNVVLESDDMNPDIPTERRGWGIEGWSMDRYEVIGNVVARRVGAMQRAGIKVSGGELVIKGNVVYDWEDARTSQSIVANSDDVTLADNLSPEFNGGLEPDYLDPARGVETYAKSIGLEAELGAYLDAVAGRQRGTWPAKFTARAINEHVREGFAVRGK